MVLTGFGDALDNALANAADQELYADCGEAFDEKCYARTNYQEYFAELTQTWLGVNAEWGGCSTLLTRCGLAVYDPTLMAVLASVYQLDAYPVAGVMLGEHPVPSDAAEDGPWFWENAEACMTDSPTAAVFDSVVETCDSLLAPFTPSALCGDCTNGKCIGPSETTCACPIGLELDSTGSANCIDINECDQYPCPSGSYCINHHQGFRCMCGDSSDDTETECEAEVWQAEWRGTCEAGEWVSENNCLNTELGTTTSTSSTSSTSEPTSTPTPSPAPTTEPSVYPTASPTVHPTESPSTSPTISTSLSTSTLISTSESVNMTSMNMTSQTNGSEPNIDFLNPATRLDTVSTLGITLLLLACTLFA